MRLTIPLSGAGVLAALCLSLVLSPVYADPGGNSGSNNGKKPAPLPPLTLAGSTMAGRHAYGVAIWSGRGRALVANAESKSVSLIDLVTISEIWEIKVGRQPMGVAINSETGIGAVTLHEESAVVLIDLNAAQVIGKVRMPGKPTGIAVDSAFNTAVVAVGHQSIVILDLGEQRILTNLLVGRRPIGVSINPLTHVAAVTNELSGTVTLVDYTFRTNPTISDTVTLPRSKGSWQGGDVHCHPHDKKHHDDLDDDDAHIKAHRKGDHCHEHGPKARPVAVAFDYAAGLNRFVVVDRGTKSLVLVDLNAASEMTRMRTLGPMPERTERPVAVAVNPGLDFGIVVTHNDDVYAFNLTNPAFIAQVPSIKGVELRQPRGVAIDPVTCRSPITTHEPHKQGNVWVLGLSCAPQLTEVRLSAGQIKTQQTLTLIGTGFVAGSTVNFGTQIGLVPLSIGPGVITVRVTLPSTTGSLDVSVTSGVNTSNSLPFQVTMNTPPTLCQVLPSSVVLDTATGTLGGPLPLTLNTSNVIIGATVTFGGEMIGTVTAITPLPTTTVGGCVISQRILVTVPGYPQSSLTLHATEPSPQVQITNPDTAQTGKLTVVLSNPVPILSPLVPNSSAVGTQDKVITIAGDNFVFDVVGGTLVTLTRVRFNGVPLDDVVPDGRNPRVQLSATVPAALLQQPAIYQVDIQNPAPGGGVSVSYPFQVQANNLPATVSVKDIPVPECSGLPVGTTCGVGPTVVALLKQSTTSTGVIGVGHAGTLHLMDVTDPSAPSYLPTGGAPLTVAVGPPGFDTIGDMAVLPGAVSGTSSQAVVAVMTDTDELATVDFAVPLVPVQNRYLLLGSTPAAPLLPVSAAADNLNKRVIVVNATNSAVVYNVATTSGTPVLEPLASLDLGPTIPTRVAVDPTLKLAAVLTIDIVMGDDRLVIVNYANASSPSVVASYQVPGGLMNSELAINSTTHEAVISQQDLQRIAVVPLNGVNAGLTRAQYFVGNGVLPPSPLGVAVDPATNRAVVADTNSNELTMVNLATGAIRVLGIGTVGASVPVRIAWDPVAPIPGSTATGLAITSALVDNGTDVNVIGGIDPTLVP